jgi:small-conductance mechanosensitive channel
VLLSLTIFLVVAYTGHRVANWPGLWRRLAPNIFLADLLAQAFRVGAFAVGLVVALNVAGATAMMTAILGGAGVLGLALGFAVRDSLDNYISSIMLSLRQPFRANDHVVIGTHEGRVARLTSRATVLVTLDGNHLRIPNSTVFKAVILNYSRNPERRFGFELGIDAADDPMAAMQTGLTAIRAFDAILDTPPPVANIESIGDSNIVISFRAWVNQEQTDFLKARSIAIRAAKIALEERGFTLPEPIYRLRFDQAGPALPAASASDRAAPPAPPRTGGAGVERRAAEANAFDVRPDTYIEEKVNEERALVTEPDLLDASKPVE